MNIDYSASYTFEKCEQFVVINVNDDDIEPNKSRFSYNTESVKTLRFTHLIYST